MSDAKTRGPAPANPAAGDAVTCSECNTPTPFGLLCDACAAAIAGGSAATTRGSAALVEKIDAHIAYIERRHPGPLYLDAFEWAFIRAALIKAALQ